MKHFSSLLLLLTVLAAPKAQAQTPTWSQDVAPIIYNHCASCHHSGGIGPFSLMTFQDAVSNASSIKTAVETGQMPPWPPDVYYTRLAHERVLSVAEKNKIVSWVNGGQQQGNIALAPPQPTFNAGGDLPGAADLVLQIPTYTSTASNSDVYRCFVLPTGLTADKYITAFEAIPGDRSIVHHVVVFADTTGICTQLDAADPGPGYTNFGGVGTNDAFMIGGWVPGTVPLRWPSGFGVKLPQNAKIVLQIHYPAGSAGLKDSTKLRIYLSPTNSVRNIMILPVLNHDYNINSPLLIPANTTRNFSEAYTIPPIFDLSLLAIAPHMHYIARSTDCFGVRPAGDTQKYISIPDWDFHWQGFYFMRNLTKMDGGTRVISRAFYDNTLNNPRNPSNPPKDVHAGEATTDEMMVTFFAFTFYQTGDENIKIDSSTSLGLTAYQPYYKGQQLLQPYPIPARDQLIAKYYFDQPATGYLEMVNSSGQVVMRLLDGQTISSGYSTLPFSVTGLAAGMYTLQLRTASGTQVQKVMVQH